MTRFINISGSGIFRVDLIRSVVPFQKVSYEIDLHPPLTHEENFEVSLTKVISIIPAISIEGEEEVVFDESSENRVTASVKLTTDEAIKELFPAGKKDKENEEAISLNKKLKNYKLRLKKIHEFEEKLAEYDSAKGSPTYDTIMETLKADAPTNDGQEKRVQDVAKALANALVEYLTDYDPDEDDMPTLLTAFVTDEDDNVDIIKNTANDLMEFYVNKLEGNKVFVDENDEGDYSEETDEGIYGDTDDSEERISAEDAVEHAIDILNSGNAITNKVPEDSNLEDEEMEDETDETEEEEAEEQTEVIDITPRK